MFFIYYSSGGKLFTVVSSECVSADCLRCGCIFYSFSLCTHTNILLFNMCCRVCWPFWTLHDCMLSPRPTNKIINSTSLPTREILTFSVHNYVYFRFSFTFNFFIFLLSFFFALKCTTCTPISYNWVPVGYYSNKYSMQWQSCPIHAPAGSHYKM